MTHDKTNAPAEWAVKRAKELSECDTACPALYAFAEYIQQHENEPDPIVAFVEQVFDELFFQKSIGTPDWYQDFAEGLRKRGVHVRGEA